MTLFPCSAVPVTRSLVVLLGLLTCACGPSAAKRPDPVGFEAGAPHTLTCGELGRQRTREVKQKRFLPPDIVLHDWPTTAHTTADSAKKTPSKRIDEADFVRLLLEGNARGTLVLARGGSGKSKLAWSLEAQLCRKLPVVRVDLRWDIPTAADPTVTSFNPVLQAVVTGLKLRLADPMQALRQAVGNRPWLLVLDSLDEIPLDQRTVRVAAINDAMKRFPALRIIVFTRPPVFHGTYGLDHVEGRAELPQLSCKRALEVQRTFLPDAKERAAFSAFTHRYGLDRVAKTATERCYLPHMSTYRDFFVLKRIAQGNTKRTAEARLSSRAQIYGFYLSVLLVKDMQGVGVLPADALLTVDRMVAGQRPTATRRNISFTMTQCMTALPLNDKNKRRSACERLMQSSLFAHDRTNGVFRLSNQSLADLFLARYTASLIQENGCAVVTKRAALFESNEVAGFLAGLKGGQRCLLELTTQLCRSGGYAHHNFTQLDQGLPAGAARLTLLRQTQDRLRTADETNLCVGAMLDRLRKARGRHVELAPSETPAPTRPDQP